MMQQIEPFGTHPLSHVKYLRDDKSMYQDLFIVCYILLLISLEDR